MKSKVYFVSVKNSQDILATSEKLKKLLDVSLVLDVAPKGERVCVKMHFGEEGNTGFVNPAYARVICDRITAKGGAAFLSDANTLYRGKRINSSDHLKVACDHGFTKEAIGAEVIIPDDTKK